MGAWGLEGFLKLRVRGGLEGLARALGFSSPQYLIRVFRETSGMTPREFGEMSAYRRQGEDAC